MAKIAKKHLDKHKEIKNNIEQARQYFDKNNKRYEYFVKAVFDTSLSAQDVTTLQQLGKPPLEFNILESFISRLRGEFSTQQPSLTTRAADGVPVTMMKELTPTIDVLQAHLRAVLFDASNDKLQYDVYSDLLAGGFSVFEVYTDYVSPKSFEQNIYVDRVFDPVLTGFDPLARKSHKGDGRFCFQLYPRTREEFEEEYGKAAAEKMRYSKNMEGFTWSYRNEQGNEEIILVCDYYVKRIKRQKVYKLTGGKSYFEDEYKEHMKKWDNPLVTEPAPVVTRTRWTDVEVIERFRLCETGILDHVETNYRHLPLVFVDGNSALITDAGVQHQMTRPYVYHALGIQKLKNFAGQSLAGELQSISQCKIMAALEAVPEDYLEAYNAPQVPNTLLYNHFYEENPEITLPPPTPLPRTPIPPEITNTFRMSDEMTQIILGSYDMALGNRSQETSGYAIALGAMQSNSASMPYVVGYIKGLNRVAQIIVDLIPKYYRTPRSLPVLDEDGKRSYEIINDKKVQGSVFMNYDPDSLYVKVEAGVNFAMQKEMALKTIVSLMQASPAFAQFMNEEGLSTILDNLEIRGIDKLRGKALEFEKKQAVMQQQRAASEKKMAEMSAQIESQRMTIEMQRAQAETMKVMKEAQSPTKTQVDMAKLNQEGQFKAVEAQQNQQKIDIDMAEMSAKLAAIDMEEFARMSEIDAEQARTAVDALKVLLGGSPE